MSTKELKISITQIIEQINDDTVLEKILENILKVQKSQIVGYDTNGDQITREGLENEIVEAKKRMENGESISHEDIMNSLQINADDLNVMQPKNKLEVKVESIKIEKGKPSKI